MLHYLIELIIRFVGKAARALTGESDVQASTGETPTSYIPQNSTSTQLHNQEQSPTPHPKPISPDPDDDEDNIPQINDVESLKKGIVKTSKNKAQAPYTILLVGETGVGKSSILELIANVLSGNDADHYNFHILDHSNELGGSSNQSQTNSARIYDLPTKNGMLVRILDTPGLADTRGLQQDEIHKKSIATQIQNISSVTAVLILANGTVPRLTVGMDYALSTLSSIFPHSLKDNIAFIFTNVVSPLAWNFSPESIPDSLRLAPYFLLDNPISLHKKYVQLKADPNMRNSRKELRKAVKEGEQTALEMLVDFFDWLDSLKPQPTTEIATLYEKSQGVGSKIANNLAQIEQAMVKKSEIDKLMRAFEKNSADVNAFSNFKKTVNMPVWKQLPTTTHNTLCSKTSCYSNCHIDCSLNFSLDPKGLKGCNAMTDDMCECGHGLWDHHHYRFKWEEVIDTQVAVDQSMELRWKAAKDAKDKTETLIAAGKKALDQLNDVIDRATNDLSRLVDDYSRLSLSKSFSAQMEKAVRLLEQSYKGMEEKGVSGVQLEKVRESLDVMKKKMKILKEAKVKSTEIVAEIVGGM